MKVIYVGKRMVKLRAASEWMVIFRILDYKNQTA